MDGTYRRDTVIVIGVILLSVFWVFGPKNIQAANQRPFDIRVSDLASPEAEILIDVNPINPDNQVIVGISQYTVNAYYTLDGGRFWTRVELGALDGFGVESFRTDPTVAYDSHGNVYVAYIHVVTEGEDAGDVPLVVAKSTDGGQNYTQFTIVDTHPMLGYALGNDKLHLATGSDPFDPDQQNVYVAWTQNVYEPAEPDLDQRVVLSASTDGGIYFSDPVIVNDPSIFGRDIENLFADPAVGPNGEVYVAWHDADADQIFTDVSTNGWTNFGTDYFVTANGINRKYGIPAAPERGAHTGPTIDVDVSGGTFNGRLYIAYTDLGTGDPADTDIFVRYSDNNGATWSPPVRVNDDGGTNSQFHPWLDVDQLSGMVALVWYDARNDPSNKKVEVFMAVSGDGGATFSPNVLISDGQSDQSYDNPDKWSLEYLEYIGVAAYGCEANPVWADNSRDLANLDIFTDWVQFTGADTPMCSQVMVSPPNLTDFLDIEVGTTATTVVTISKPEAIYPWQLVSIDIPQDPYDVFELIDAPDLPAWIAPGDSIEVPIAYSPKDCYTIEFGTLEILSSGSPRVLSYQLSGMGKCSEPPPGPCFPLIDCGGVCVDTATDLNNCGDCGIVCIAPIGGDTSCDSGACTYSCDDPDEVICGDDVAGRVCENLDTDVTNCGACGIVCPNPIGGTAVCAAGECANDCGGLTDCSGVCIDTSNDNDNCGGCGLSCPIIPNATSYCSAGLCDFYCDPGFERDTDACVPITIEPRELLVDLIDYYLTALDTDALNGTGDSQLASVLYQLIMYRHLFMALTNYDLGRINATCFRLNRAYLRADGLPDPYEFLEGPGLAEFQSRLLEVAAVLDCAWVP